MTAKDIWITERSGIARDAEPVRVSVPFGAGELPGEGTLRLTDPLGGACPVQSEVLGRWPDGSVKWLLCDFLAAAPPHGTVAYRLQPGAGEPSPHRVSVVAGEDAWQVDTGSAHFTVDTRTLCPFDEVRVQGRVCSAGKGECRMTFPDGSTETAQVESVALEAVGALRATLLLRGRFGTPEKALFACRLHFFAGKSHVELELTLHNPRAARHAGGLWDLGDPGSLVFSELAVSFPFPDATAPRLSVLPEPGGEALAASEGEPLCVRQESSGGARRLSPTHANATGGCSASQAGYLVLAGERLLSRGERATPLFHCAVGEGGISAVLPRFWQEFPKAIAADAGALAVSLFPAGTPEPHELQGGEQKTTTLFLDFASPAADCRWMTAPLAAVAAPAAVRAAGVLPDLPADPDLVERFTSAGELCAKREEIDEYGWRHFGEVYADHEAVYHQGEEPFVSHYNNQYDLCAGVYRKFLATGDPAWGELAADLARHVLDIDIYHTDEDREEYSGGLFWHTDHYITAGLATHRTFSRVHLAVKDPRFYGGGPAAEHCYTGGLLLHYYLTGNRDFRDAVLGLADWSYRSLSGVPTLLATLKRGVAYLSQARRQPGVLFPRYPLTRGTGNTLGATLDAFQAGGGERYLARAEELVAGALHPEDDIEARNLLEPEVAWSYSVLLAAVAKFLDVKRGLGRFDAGFAHARGALLSYARWMVRHEYPYLHRPEKLEYPNETWAAQELRKSVVLYHAARYAPPGEGEPFFAKARELAEAAVADLERFPTSRCTRPLALMLQNGWVVAALSGAPPAPLQLPTAEPAHGAPTPRLGISSAAARIGAELSVALKETSLRREMAWLKARLS